MGLVGNRVSTIELRESCVVESEKNSKLTWPGRISGNEANKAALWKWYWGQLSRGDGLWAVSPVKSRAGKALIRPGKGRKQALEIARVLSYTA